MLDTPSKDPLHPLDPLDPLAESSYKPTQVWRFGTRNVTETDAASLLNLNLLGFCVCCLPKQPK